MQITFSVAPYSDAKPQQEQIERNKTLLSRVLAPLMMSVFPQRHLIDRFNGFHRLFISLLQQGINMTLLQAWLEQAPGIRSRVNCFVNQCHYGPSHSYSVTITLTDETHLQGACYWLVTRVRVRYIIYPQNWLHLWRVLPCQNELRKIKNIVCFDCQIESKM